MTASYAKNYAGRWIKNLWSVLTIRALFEAFGGLWTLTEIANYFLSQANDESKTHYSWPWFLLVGFLYAAWRRRPQTRIAHKLNGQDITIELVVSDIFDLSGSLIVGSNTTFDTKVSPQLISKTSVQGQFTEKYYSDSTQLDVELDAALRGLQYETIPDSRTGKRNRYPLGTCVRLNPRDRVAYFIAIAEINPHGVASSHFEDLQSSLPKLWGFIATRGLKEDLLMPVLGTGFSRLPVTREAVIREVILSFLAACSERTFCDKLTIAIAPQDLAKNKLPLEDLGDFVRHHCRYRNPVPPIAGHVGSPAT